MTATYNKKIGGAWELVKDSAAPGTGVRFDITAHYQAVALANTASKTAPAVSFKGQIIPAGDAGSFELDNGEYLYAVTANRRGSATLAINEQT